MIDLVTQLKVRYGLKIAVVSNEARELNAYRIRKFKLDKFVDFFISSCFVHIRKPDADIFRLRWTSPSRAPSRSSISKTRRCSFRSLRVWGFEVFFTRITSPPARNWPRPDCGMTKTPSVKSGNVNARISTNKSGRGIKFAVFEAGDLASERLESGRHLFG
jgi:hypothetical protein